eukprot:jgi/Botrbrau1/12733/Bobra.67_1s0092.1
MAASGINAPLLQDPERREDGVRIVNPTPLLVSPQVPQRREDGIITVNPAPPRQGGDEHIHYVTRSPWLRAAVLGANDGLVSVGSLLLGVSAANPSTKTVLLSGVSALLAGALSMGVGEYISVSSQLDTEKADIQKEVEAHATSSGRIHETEELAQIYVSRGLDYALARQVAEKLENTDAIRAHARDELNIDMDELANPWQAAFTSMLSFFAGAIGPLLVGILVTDPFWRQISILGVATLALLVFGSIGAWLGGARKVRGAARVLLGGWIAMGVTYGAGALVGGDVPL